jgi:guanyl-specific ribonuclease Sa
VVCAKHPVLRRCSKGGPFGLHFATGKDGIVFPNHEGATAVLAQGSSAGFLLVPSFVSA